MKEYYKQLYTNKLDKPYEVDKFLERYNQQNLLKKK